MRTLTGQIDCRCKVKRSFEPGTSAHIYINDISVLGAPSKLIAKTVIKDLQIFPFRYEIKFDDSAYLKSPTSTYSVSASIDNKQGRTIFYTNTAVYIKNHQTGALLDNVDFHVVGV